MIFHYLINSILVIQVIMLVFYIVLFVLNKAQSHPKLRLISITAVNIAVLSLPKFYKNLSPTADKTNWLFILIDTLGDSIKMFVGEINTTDFTEFANTYKMFYVILLLGALIAITNTYLVADNIFRNRLKNRRLLKKRLTDTACDIVVGHSASALKYVQNHNASVLLVDDNVSKETVATMIDSKISVLHHNYSNGFFEHPFFNKTTRYNIICPKDEGNVLEYIDSFISYRSSHPDSTNFYLYVEIDSDMAETIRREIIDKSNSKTYITTFCSSELLARTFTEQHPITKYLPSEYIENAAIKPDTELYVYMLGFGKLSREIYRQLILRNQFVKYENGEYRILPVKYTIYDPSVDPDDEIINGISKDLAELDQSLHFPLPEAPFIAEAFSKSPTCHDVISRISSSLSAKNSYTYIIVNTDDDCRNIELGVKIKNRFCNNNNFHVFVKSVASYTEDCQTITYFGKGEDVFVHNVIVNDSLSQMAKKLHDIYLSKNMQSVPWDKLDSFTLCSNIQAALNLRVTLNLLGLDYAESSECKNLDLIEKRLNRENIRDFEDYFKKSTTNAIIAQEHTRWNAYHLLNGYLPLERDSITRDMSSTDKIKFITKKTITKRHATLTTYKGVGDVSYYLASLAGDGYTAKNYDYYQYDTNLLDTIKELFEEIGYSIIDKNQSNS